jgi:hypothetical protein
METGYLCNPNTTVFYCPLFLLKRRKTGANFSEANLIWVAPERRDIGGFACLYCGTFGRSAYSQKQ